MTSVRTPPNTTPAGVIPSSAPAGTPLTVTRWISRDGVRNSVAVAAIEFDDCDWCARPFTVEVLTPVWGEGLLCAGCCERLREEALHATA